MITKFIEFSRVVKFNTYIQKMEFSLKKLIQVGRLLIVETFQLVKILILLQLNLAELLHTKVNLYKISY